MDRPGPGRSVGMYLALVVAWGLNYLFVHAGLAYSPPLWLAAGRSTIGAVGVGVLLLLSRRPPAGLGWTGRRDALLLGLPNTAMFFGLWFVAAGSVLPGEAAVVVYTFPLWVALLSPTVLGYRLGSIPAMAVVAGFGGIVLVTEPWSGATSLPPIAAVLELLGGAVSWAVGTVLFQRRFRPAEMQEANFYQLLGGSAGLLAASALLSPVPATPGLPLVAILLWLGLVGTAASYSIWFYLLARTPAARLSSYVFLVPIVALAASVLLVGERLEAVQVVGVATVVASIYVAGRRAASPPGPAR
ncbi:MAG TPA: EamA family transporter [Thermoplasmata archaeon]|nr:EamA family transporter [Thermoplasmata archaeon]